jgi:hypothetical protein
MGEAVSFGNSIGIPPVGRNDKISPEYSLITGGSMDIHPEFKLD